MTQVPPKPDGSDIEEFNDGDGRSYRWKMPSAGVIRFAIAVFLLFWLGGWAFGWISAFHALLQNNPNGLNAGLLLWLGGWTLGGVFVFYMLYLLIRPTRPECITLGYNSFRYDPGRVSMATYYKSLYNMRNANSQASYGKLFKRQKCIEIAKSDLGPVVLERVGERQRLYFDYGADRIEIGEYLREPEREWLAAVIEAWKES